jgi:ADP-ribose pyrophosphatase YjhB (NUDIX family)
LNFIGGGLELGETLDECIKRKILVETFVGISRMKYIFIVENFISFKEEIIHGIGFYYLVELNRENVVSALDDHDFIWYQTEELANLELRPTIVRDCISDGSY